MSDDNEATEEDEPTRCRKCGSHYNLRDGEDPTPYCDWCAHKVVDELRREVEALKHCLVRHNCGKPECLCVKCCREEDARNALTPPV